MNKVSYEFYTNKVDKINISFPKLGEKECEECVFYNDHKHEANGECKVCDQESLYDGF